MRHTTTHLSMTTSGEQHRADEEAKIKIIEDEILNKSFGRIRLWFWRITN